MLKYKFRPTFVFVIFSNLFNYICGLKARINELMQNKKFFMKNVSFTTTSSENGQLGPLEETIAQ